MVVERQMQESTPLMARKREQETLCYFFRVPGQTPSLFITQQVLLSFLSSFLVERGLMLLDRIRPVSAR